jgi:hypothetical protein
MPTRESVVPRASRPLTWEFLPEQIEAHSQKLAIALCLCFALTSAAIGYRRPFWCDEIITISITHAPTLADVVSKFLLTFDQTPPLNAILVRLFSDVFGWTELAARIPSILFACAGVFLVFQRVKTLTSGLYGLIALAILLNTFLPGWSYEARPYSMLFFASSLAMWAWTRDFTDAGEKRTNALVFGLATMLAIFAHYYGILLILPFVAEELRTKGLRPSISFKLLCGAVGLILGLAIHLPFIRSAARFRELPFWGIPSLRNLQGSYPEILLRVVLVVVFAIVLLAWAGWGRERSVEPPGMPERLGWYFLGLPIAGYVMAKLVTHAFWPRYFVPMLAGFGLAAGCALFRFYRSNVRVPLLILVVSLGFFLESSVSQFRNAKTGVVTKRTEEADFADQVLGRIRKDGKRFVLLPSLNSYLEARFYASNPDMLRALLTPNFPQWFIAQNPTGIRYFSMDELRQNGNDTALIAPSAPLLDQLDHAGFRIHWRLSKPLPLVYLEAQQ